MSKFYAVKGEEKLIFTSWDDCRFFLDGKTGYKHKSFSTEEEAKAFLEDRDYYGELIQNDLNTGFAVAFTDGSFEENVGRYSYGVIAVHPNGEEQTFCASDNKAEFLSSRNIIGEVEGVLCALKWAYLNGYKKLKIYHDYEGLATWFDGRWNASGATSTYYVSKISKYKGVLDVYFQKVKGHSNNKYNDLVDKLAKQALFDGKEQTIDGFGYKISGTYYLNEFISWINKKAPKAKIETFGQKTTFTVENKYLSVYPGITACAVVGNNQFLYTLSCVYFLENHRDMGVNRLIERFFDVYIENGTECDYFFASITALSFLSANKAPSIIFALYEVENFIKRKLLEKDKISPYFKNDGNGYFVLNDKRDDSQIIEKAYNFFYKWRVNYFNLNLDEKQALQIINLAKEIIKE